MEAPLITDYRIVETEKGFYIQQHYLTERSEHVPYLLFFSRIIVYKGEGWRTIPNLDKPLCRPPFGDHPVRFEPLMFDTLEKAKDFIKLLIHNLSHYPIYHYLNPEK